LYAPPVRFYSSIQIKIGPRNLSVHLSPVPSGSPSLTPRAKVDTHACGICYRAQTMHKARPGWVWAIAVWHFGGTALLFLFLILVYSGAVHMTALHRAKWDGAVSHTHIANLIVAFLLLTGTWLLFQLRKSAFYAYCAVLAGNCLICAWIALAKGMAALPRTPVLVLSLGLPLIFCIYSKHLVKKKILV